MAYGLKHIGHTTLALCLFASASTANALSCWRGLCFVEKGDTVAKIAREQGVSIATVQRALELNNPNQLLAGTSFREAALQTEPTPVVNTPDFFDTAANSAVGRGMPYQETYTAESGDTLFAVMRKTGVDWQTIASLNSMRPPFTLYVGQVINISPVKYK